MKKIKAWLFKPFKVTIPLLVVTDQTAHDFWAGFWYVLHTIAVYLDKI